jgi:hypothetical protein
MTIGASSTLPVALCMRSDGRGLVNPEGQHHALRGDGPELQEIHIVPFPASRTTSGSTGAWLGSAAPATRAARLTVRPWQSPYWNITVPTATPEWAGASRSASEECAMSSEEFRVSPYLREPQ